MRVTLALFVVALALSAVLLVAADGRSDKMAKYNARVGAKYLEEKCAEEGVTKLASGVCYRVLSSGSGTRSPGPNDQVKVHYRGTLINGKQFDSSYDRGSPATFGVGGVIKGWTEILQLMHEGDTWEVYIPSHKAYGPGGTGKDIGPNSTLIFKVELIEILGSGAGPGKRPPMKKAPKRPAPPKKNAAPAEEKEL